MSRELLVILQGDPEDAALADIRRRERVTQLVSERVFAIEHPGPDRLAELCAVPGALVFEKGRAPEQLPAELAEEERLWIRAWNRRRDEGKERPGSGVPWDAQGFEPPDAPRRG